MPNTIPIDDLDPLLSNPGPRAAWVTALCADLDVRALDDDDLCDIAAECAGTHAGAVNSLIEGLRVRHARDRVTVAALAAIQDYHVAALLGARAR